MKDVASQGMSRRQLLRAAGAGIVGAGIVGAGGCRGFGGESARGGKSLSMTWWGEGKRSQLGVQVTKLFQEKNPDVKIDAQFSGFAGYWDKLATRVAGGNAPSIFQLHITTLSEYAGRGACRDLSSLWSKQLGLDKLTEQIQASCRIDNKPYFVPLGVASQPAVVYNRTLLRKLGVGEPNPDWTIDDLRTFGREVTRVSKGKFYGITDFGGGHQGIGAWLRSQGKQLFRESGELGLDKADLRTWYALWKELRDTKACVPTSISAAGAGFQNNPMIKGQAALTFAASCKGIEGLQNLSKDELALLTFPKYDSNAKPSTHVAPVEWFAFSSKLSDEQADVAADLCRFWLTDPQVLSIVKLWHGVPLFPELRGPLEEKAKGVHKLIYDNVELVESYDTSPSLPFPPGAAQLLETVHGENNEAIGFGKTTVDEAVDRFFAEAERALK